jgi:predicted transcriptional regulator
MRYIAAHVDTYIIDAVDKLAADLRLSRAALIRMALESYLDRPHRLVQVDQAPATAPLLKPTED